ncbi:hypothetical protein [Erythrobacter sp. Alg231-14]|uniref:hypothetical protein n=1 Tax=Erythrobacter sp. Alg231-14 TaxID=1922225 RepID=UPI00307B91D0
MSKAINTTARKQRKLSLLGMAAALTLTLPSAGLAVVGLGESAAAPVAADDSAAYDMFTPASIDPELAARVAKKARERGIRFTPAGTAIVGNERTVTVAVRIDDQSAQAISIRSAQDAKPGLGSGLNGVTANRFNLGTARGYQSFARTQAANPAPSGVSLPTGLEQSPVRSGRTVTLSNPAMPDLSEFEPSRPTRLDKPSRLQPRIELEDETVAGRSPNTLDALSSQTVDVGGSFRLSPNFDVRAGVRLSQERDRLDPVANSVQDSQAVYVGTQIRF